jgi:hypothetical protein
VDETLKPLLDSLQTDRENLVGTGKKGLLAMRDVLRHTQQAKLAVETNERVGKFLARLSERFQS